jgi:hypothetical protein
MASNIKKLTVQAASLNCVLTTSGGGDVYITYVQLAAFQRWDNTPGWDHYAMLDSLPDGEKMEFVDVGEAINFAVENGLKIERSAEGSAY